MQINIKKFIDTKIPGGLMVVPLLLGSLCKTFFPDAGSYFGSFTNGLISGTVPILAVWFFCMGAGINLKSTGVVLKKSGVLLITKLLVAWIVAMIVTRILPFEGIQSGIFAGFSALAIIAAMDYTNAGLYASLMQQYGSKEEAGAFVLLTVEAGPFCTMVILGITGVGSFEPQMFVGAILPFLLGFILGNIDADLRAFFSKATHTLIPFFAFALGNSIDLMVIAKTGFSGILLGVGVIIITGIPLILADRLIAKGNGTAGLAASSTAGAAAATPFLIAEMKPEFAVVAPSATVMVATCVIVTAILVPLLTFMWSKKFNPNHGKINVSEVDD